MAREGRGIWAKRVERWRDSGLTAREYAAELGINHNTLQYWGWKLSGESSASPRKALKRDVAKRRAAKPVPVVEVIGTQAAISAPSEAPIYEVMLASGLTVRVPAHFDDVSLGRLLSVLEAR